MYSYLWKKIKLPVLVKIILTLLILLAVIAALFLYIFPLLANYIPYPMGNYGVDPDGL